MSRQQETWSDERNKRPPAAVNPALIQLEHTKDEIERFLSYSC